MVGGPTLLMLCAILAIGMNFFMVASMDHAALVGARAIATGSVSSAGMSASSFKQNVVCPALPSLFSCSDVYVNVVVAAAGSNPSGYYTLVNSSQSGLIQPALDSSKNTFCPGASSQYVVLQVIYPAPILFAFLAPTTPTVYNGHNVAVMMSSTTFLSEPYGGAQSYQGC